MKVLLYDNYDSFTYNLVHLLEASDARVEVSVMRNDETDLDRWRSFDGVVLSPGPGLPQESGLLMKFIQEAAGHVPILGVCLGLQALVVHFGGKLINLDRVLHGVALPTRINSPQDALFKDISNPFLAGRYHSWVADPANLPEILTVTASDESGQVMAVRHRELNISAVQFHPESILTPEGPKILQNWVKSC
jgi:anthranilate synthase component 2